MSNSLYNDGTVVTHYATLPWKCKSFRVESAEQARIDRQYRLETEFCLNCPHENCERGDCKEFRAERKRILKLTDAELAAEIKERRLKL